MAAVVPTIRSEGGTLDPSIGIFSIEVRKELDRIPEARLVLADGSVAAREFALSNTELLALGKRVTILFRRGSEVDQAVFSGVVVRQVVEAHPDGTRLRVELKDAAFKLSRRRRIAVHREQRDHDVVRAMIQAADLEMGTIDDTIVRHHELVQYNTSDWDFLLSRADASGQVVIVDDGKISVRNMAKAVAAEVQVRAHFELGLNLETIHELELELDGSGQWGAVTSEAWDATRPATSEPVEGAPLALRAGNLDVASVATAMGGESQRLVLPAPISADELAPWASSRLARSRLSLIRGRLVVNGRADVRPFDRIGLGGVGARFNGELLVAGVIHRFDLDGWRTELRLGLSPEWFARTPEIADVPAGGLLPPAMGLQIGVVDAYQEDPEGQRRIKVCIPGLPPEQGSLWARMARPDAGPERGFVFWPEPGDEVVVGFLADDPRQAVVLGALHGSGHAPPVAASEANAQRVLVSRAGTTIIFDDDKPSLTIRTTGSNTIVVDDDAQAITIADQHGNTITMDANGIKLASASDFLVDAAGDVVIRGSAVDIQ